MLPLRTRLIGVAAALLLQQAAGVALVAALACCAGTSAPAAMECCRKGGTDHICPLTPRDGDRAPCRMKSACTRDHAAGPAAPFFAWAAPIPDLLILAAPPLHPAARDESSFRPLRADLPPPGPPPKP